MLTLYYIKYNFKRQSRLTTRSCHLLVHLGGFEPPFNLARASGL